MLVAQVRAQLFPIMNIGNFRSSVIGRISVEYLCLFEALRLGQHFPGHFGTASWAQPVLSNEDEVSCLRTQHRTPSEFRICNLTIKSPSHALPTELSVPPSSRILLK